MTETDLQKQRKEILVERAARAAHEAYRFALTFEDKSPEGEQAKAYDDLSEEYREKLVSDAKLLLAGGPYDSKDESMATRCYGMFVAVASSVLGLEFAPLVTASKEEEEEDISQQL